MSFTGSLAPCLVTARAVRWIPRLAGTRQYPHWLNFCLRTRSPCEASVWVLTCGWTSFSTCIIGVVQFCIQVSTEVPREVIQPKTQVGVTGWTCVCSLGLLARPGKVYEYEYENLFIQRLFKITNISSDAIDPDNLQQSWIKNKITIKMVETRDEKDLKWDRNSCYEGEKIGCLGFNMLGF